MPRRTMLVAVFTVFAAVNGLGQPGSQPATSTAGPFGGPILTTPTATLPSPAPTAGISDAGRAGISVNPVAAPVVPGVPAETTATVSETASPTAEEAATNNLLSSTSAAEGAAPVSMSVAEASAQMRARQAVQKARVLTNDDVEKMLTNKAGVTMARNMPPLGPGALEQSAAASAGPESTSPPDAAQQAQSGAASREHQGTPPPVDTGQGRPAGPEATAGNATTPQINQKPESNDAQGRSRLPATSTLLPLLGLLGMVSGGMGLWFRRFRK